MMIGPPAPEVKEDHYVDYAYRRALTRFIVLVIVPVALLEGALARVSVIDQLIKVVCFVVGRNLRAACNMEDGLARIWLFAMRNTRSCVVWPGRMGSRSARDCHRRREKKENGKQRSENHIHGAGNGTSRKETVLLNPVPGADFYTA